MTTFATMATSTARLGYMSVKPHGKFLKRPATQVHDVIREIERDAAKRIFRKGESADVVITDLRRVAALRMAEVKDDIALLPSWLSKDVDAIADRRLNQYGGHLANDETPGYFDPAKGATP